MVPVRPYTPTANLEKGPRQQLTLRDVETLAKRHGTNFEDVLLIALNAYGARSEFRYPRARMLLKLCARSNEPLRMGLPLARFDSPFVVRDDHIYLGHDLVADIVELADDDALLGYYRKEGTVLVLNSNARSHCTGCVFCPNTLEGASDPRLAVLDDLDTYFKILQLDSAWTDLSRLEEVNLVTGCFQKETNAVTHLRLVHDALVKHRFTGRLGFLSSVLRTGPVFAEIAASLAPFMLVVTLECFTQRNLILKHSKATLLPEEVPGILDRAREHGLDCGFTYIVGLEPMDAVIDQLRELCKRVTQFPNFQIYQSHNQFMAQYAAQGADTVEYFLTARSQLERLFDGRDIRPQTWANYRTLWYFTFAGEELKGPRT